MGVFDKMLSDSYKHAFIERKRSKLRIDESYLADLTEYISSSECDEDIRRLKRGDYYLDAPIRFFIRKNHSTRRRAVYSFKNKDKYILQYMTFVLLDYDDIHADSLCSFRVDKHTKGFFNKVKRIDPHRTHYIMKTDIHNYGSSIDQDLVVGFLSDIFSDDPEFLNFFTWIFTRNEFYSNDRLIHERVSITEGLPLGSFILNIYLSEMDKILEPEAVIYMRYTDDIVFFCDTKEEAEWALDQVKKVCRKLNISINEKKTQIVCPGETAEILGIDVFDCGFDIGTNSMQKILSKFKRFRDKQLRLQRYGKCSKEVSMKRMIRFVDRTLFGFRENDHEFNWVIHAFPVITRTDSLAMLDRYVQDCIRVAGSGKLGQARYRVRYKDMCKAGYRCLVHAYYHGYTVEEVVQDADTADHANTVIR